jgi:hypothetical protein
MLAHGFTVETLGRLVLNGHATAAPGIMYAGNRPIEVTRLTITDVGRRAVAVAAQGRADGRASTLPELTLSQHRAGLPEQLAPLASVCVERDPDLHTGPQNPDPVLILTEKSAALKPRAELEAAKNGCCYRCAGS